MKRLICAFFITTVSVITPAAAQGPETGSPPTIDAVEIAGIENDRLSTEFRRDIRALEGMLLDEEAVQELADRVGQARLERENAEYREIVSEGPRMVGASGVFRQVVDQASGVARSDARVLLTGKSGTGKELFAAHIHRESHFADGPFVKVNCAAIPTELIESEVFGHETGAFTGATSCRRGRFELADGGTICLDEVGDLHASSQVKLLRVLQESDFERVGGEQTVRTSVRVIAATTRNLESLIARDEFREDFYYRLSVVPVPPLREGREDIARWPGAVSRTSVPGTTSTSVRWRMTHWQSLKAIGGPEMFGRFGA
jgi:transcriptional regulator with GAF, ATPase, and Fis domain